MLVVKFGLPLCSRNDHIKHRGFSSFITHFSLGSGFEKTLAIRIDLSKLLVRYWNDGPSWLRFWCPTRPSANTGTFYNLHYHLIILVDATMWCTTLR